MQRRDSSPTPDYSVPIPQPIPSVSCAILHRMKYVILGFGPTETEIMEALWAYGPLTVRQVRAEIQAHRRTFGSFGCLVIEHFGMYTEAVSPPLSGSADGNSLDAAPRPGAPAARLTWDCFGWSHLNLRPCLHADDNLLSCVWYVDDTRP